MDSCGRSGTPELLDSVEHKAGWHQYANGHAQVAYRAKALRTPEPTYSRSRFCFRTSIVKA